MSGPISHIDLRDIGRIADRVLIKLGYVGKSYVLTGPEAVIHEEIAEMLRRAFSRTIRYPALRITISAG